MPKTITLAKVEMDGLEIIPDQFERFDGVNYRNKTRSVPRACGMVWLLEGYPADVEKAKSYARDEGYTVYLFPTDEADPIGKAKAQALAALTR